MNKKIVLISAAFALAATVTPAFADQQSQTATSSSTGESSRKEIRTKVREKFQEEKTEIKADIQAKRNEIAQKIAEKRLEFQNIKEKMTQEKCKNIETRLSTRIGRYENNTQMLQTVYGNMQARLSRLLDKLKTAGADTTQFEKDLATLNVKIEKLKTDQAAFVTGLKDSQSTVCTATEGEFKVKIDKDRKVPELIKQDRQDIKNFFQTTIKTDLQTIRKQLELAKTDQKNADATTTQTQPTAEPKDDQKTL